MIMTNLNRHQNFNERRKEHDMLGAIIGDIVGSTREWHNVKTEDFELLPPGSRFTDDTVMTLAVAKWLMDDPSHEADSLVRIMQDMGRRYPNAGYGGMFRKWLMSDNPQPYGSYGNGSAMRVSPVGMYAKSLEEALELARITASVTHSHPEGIKGAQAVAAAVYLQLNEMFSKNGKIKQFVEEKFGYNLDIKLEDIRDDYHFDVTCQGSVPIAIMAFLQRYTALDSLRLAISMGGDSDTIGCMTASIADAQPFSRVPSSAFPSEVIKKCRELLPQELLEINDRFEAFVRRPLYQSYYLNTRNIFAGEYPGDKYGEKAEKKINQMVHFGVRHFIDLTEEGELHPYSHLLPKGCTYTRFPIRDVDVPDSMESVCRLIVYIQELSKRDDGYVYIHCWGGVGRTGTIVGCYLADGNFDSTMNKLRNCFSQMPKSSHRVTPETKAQEAFIKKYIEGMEEREQRRKERVKDCILQNKTSMNTLQDRIRGCLIGGAIGDALGYPVEFMSLKGIKHKYGDDGCIDYQVFNKEGKAAISDDTQMTLFTANGLLYGITRYCTQDSVLAGLETYVAYAYQDWLQTQDGVGNYYEYHYCWIRDIAELNVMRAPGNTCMSALRNIHSGLKVENDSKGCGGVMRVAPVGLMAAADNDTKFRWKPWESEEVAKLGGDCAVITHKHPLGYLPAAFLADLIFHIMETEVPVTYSVFDSYLGAVYSDLQRIYTEEREQKALRELWSLIEKAVDLAADWRVLEENAIQQLGEGWTGDEALAIAIYCTMRHIDDFWQAVAAAVNHDGDSDSTGAVCGNLMGAIVGYEAIPSRLTQDLELKALILEMADDLSKLCIIGVASQRAGSQKDVDCWDTKYIKNELVIEEKSWKNAFGMHKPYHILPQAQRAIEAKQLLEALGKDEELAFKCKKGYQLATKVYDTETFKPHRSLPYDHLCEEPEFLDLKKAYLPAFYYWGEDPKYSPRNSNRIFKLNLLCFEGKNPVVAVRNDTLDQRNELRAGLVNYYEKSICEKYPGWEFYLLDPSTADGNYAVFTNQLEKDFAVEIAHLWENGTLHRIYHLFY